VSGCLLTNSLRQATSRIDPWYDLPMLPAKRRAVQEGLLILAALLAVALAVVRACVQSLTEDEADTYFWFVARPGYLWYPFPNNHILNTLLMWIATHAFGPFPITLRLPALVGAILYIFTCYFLCRRITDRYSLQFAIFICLVYNPFILDFMVAARGYSLADAFFLAAIAIPVWHRAGSHPSLHASCALASLALGLSFTANFSFAFVDAAACLAIMTWAIRRRDEESLLRIVGSSVLPGLLVAFLICGYPLLHWPRKELWYGANSLSETAQSLIQASLYQMNPRFSHSGLYGAINFIKPLLLPALGALCVSKLVVMGLEIPRTKKPDADARSNYWLGRFASALIGITALAVLMHWLAFRFDQLPLPLGRTGIFFIPLCTLVAGIIAAAPARSLVGRWFNRGVTGALICLACYFLICLRWTYFKEYKDDADVKDVYSVLALLNHRYGVADVAVLDSLYVSPLNFYRVLSKREAFPEFMFVAANEFPVGKSIYVMHGGYCGELIEKQRLVVLYRGKSTEVVVAVRPNGPIPLKRLHPE
jgi:hypothetical protein